MLLESRGKLTPSTGPPKREKLDKRARFRKKNDSRKSLVYELELCKIHRPLEEAEFCCHHRLILVSPRLKILRVFIPYLSPEDPLRSSTVEDSSRSSVSLSHLLSPARRYIRSLSLTSTMVQPSDPHHPSYWTSNAAATPGASHNCEAMNNRWPNGKSESSVAYLQAPARKDPRDPSCLQRRQPPPGNH